MERQEEKTVLPIRAFERGEVNRIRTKGLLHMFRTFKNLYPQVFKNLSSVLNVNYLYEENIKNAIIML